MPQARQPWSLEPDRERAEEDARHAQRAREELAAERVVEVLAEEIRERRRPVLRDAARVEELVALVRLRSPRRDRRDEDGAGSARQREEQGGPGDGAGAGHPSRSAAGAPSIEARSPIASAIGTKARHAIRASGPLPVASSAVASW